MLIKKQAFTLVELIVLITILVILAWIWFSSVTSYLVDVRDSSRIVELDNMKSSLESYYTQNSFYPIPEDYKDINYSWAVLWSQWTFWKSIAKVVWYNKDNILDPSTDTYYTYSVKNSRKEYSIAAVLEKKDSLSAWNSILKSSYAEDGIWTVAGTAYVVWNYNGSIISANTWWLNYILAIPSIVSTNLTSTNVEDIINNNKLVYTGFDNLPSSYSWTIFKIDAWIDFRANTLLIFSWSLSDFFIEENRILFLNSIKETYFWTLASGTDQFIASTINTDINVISPDNQTSSLACDLINYKLNFGVDCNFVRFASFYILDNSLDLLNIDFSGLPWTKVYNIFLDSNWDLWFGTDDGVWFYDVSLWTWTIFTTDNWLPSNDIVVISQDNDWNMWFWTSNAWVSIYNWSYFNNYDKVNTSWEIPHNIIYDIVYNSTLDEMWIATQQWPSYYNGTFNALSVSDWNPQNRSKDIYIDIVWNIWFWTDKWAVRRDATNDTMQVFDWNHGLPYKWNKKTNIKVSSIFEDNDWNMRFWTDNWIWKLSSDPYNPLNIYTSTSGEWLANNSVYSIFQDVNTWNMWFWTQSWVSVLSWSTFTNYSKDINEQDLWAVYVIYRSWDLNVLWTEYWTTTLE